MKGYSGWSYSPYTPPLFDGGDIYICRLVPERRSVTVFWLSDGSSGYTVFWRKRGALKYGHANAAGCSYKITGLETDTDYELYVARGDKKSRVRLARTGFIEGSVVNYLHPEDGAYSFSGNYLCSPSWVRLPDGGILASMDVFGIPQNLTLLFRSDDDGVSWRYVSELMPCYWGRLFVHNGELYMLACSTEYGDLLIGRSADGGKTFGTPSVLLRGSHHKSVGVHKAPQNMLVHKGRLYATLEWGSWRNPGDYFFAAMVMSCDESDDLLDPASWHFSEPVKYDPSRQGAAKGRAYDHIEGTLVVAPGGELLNIMRYNIEDCEPSFGRVIAYRVNTDDPDAPLEFFRFIDFPANNAKFMIKYDPVSQKYWSIGDRIDCAERRMHRNLLSLLVSDDLENWRVAADIFDYRHADPKKVGFQYVDFSFEGEDILFISRTAMNGAHSYHDSNCITFHRIKDFRSTDFNK